MIATRAVRERMQAAVDEIMQDVCVLKLHTGPPGDGTQNLAFGDGLPTEYSHSAGGRVVFTIPAIPPPVRRWWHRFRKMPKWSPSVEIHAVSAWYGGKPIFVDAGLRRPITLFGGDSLMLSTISGPTLR